MDIEILSNIEARVLGALMEKSRTTPDNYPLTLNSTVVASNQKSNRDPVMELETEIVSEALDSLKRKNFIWEVVISGSSRMPKYEEKIATFYQLDEKQFAILALLLLRGPQTPGELNSRSARYCSFDSVADVENSLETLTSHLGMELVYKLPLQPGKRESRYMHTLVEYDSSENSEQVVEAVVASRSQLEERVETLESMVAELKAQFETFRDQFE